MEQQQLKPSAGEVVPSMGTDIKHTFRLFWPIFLGQLASTSMSVVDTVMSGIAGTTQLSGVAIGASFYFPSVLFLIGMTLAIQPTIAQLRGSGRNSEIPKKVHLATVVCLVTSVIIGVIVCLLPLFYKLMPNIDQEMVRVGQGYLIAIALGMPALGFYNVMRGYWEGLGYTIPTLVFGFASLILNIPLNYIFIFGLFGIPAMGGIGCGVATSLTIYIVCIAMLIYVLKSKQFAQYRLYQRWFSTPFHEVIEFLRFSLPLALSTTIEVLCFSLVALLLSPFGPVVVASHSIALNVSGLLFMVPLSIGSAITIRIGESMGTLHWNRARRSTWGALSLGFIFYVISLTGMLLFKDNIIGLYTNDIEVQTLAGILIMFCLIYLFSDSMQIIMIGVLRGFKDSRTIFIVTVVSYWIIGMPVGYSFAYGYITGEQLAAQGFWLGFICALTTATILYTGRLIYIYRKKVIPRSLMVSLMEHQNAMVDAEKASFAKQAQSELTEEAKAAIDALKSKIDLEQKAMDIASK